MASDPGVVTLVVATRNTHKVGEIRAILGERFRCITLNDFSGVPKVVEDASTFAGNATKKAVELARWLAGISDFKGRISNSCFVLADDSGLEVDALDGAPGVHSARFAALDAGRAGNSSDTENNAKLLRLLKDVPAERRSAKFRCVLALTPVLPAVEQNVSPVCSADQFELQTRLFEGTCEGRIGFAPQGQGGFGYDPLFLPEGFDGTFAELGEAEKNRLSHRARALQQLQQDLTRTV